MLTTTQVTAFIDTYLALLAATNHHTVFYFARNEFQIGLYNAYKLKEAYIFT